MLALNPLLHFFFFVLPLLDPGGEGPRYSILRHYTVCRTGLLDKMKVLPHCSCFARHLHRVNNGHVTLPSIVMIKCMVIMILRALETFLIVHIL